MRDLFISISILIAASIGFTSCEAPTANNASAGNKAATNTAPVPAADTAAIETEIKKLVTEYAAAMAKNDPAAFEKGTSDNFMFVGNDGSVQTKAERLAGMKSGATKYESLTYDDLNVRVNAEGNGAVVIGRAVVKGTNMGKPVEGANRVTQVWSKTKDGWKMVSLQATAMTAKPDDKKSDDEKADDKMKRDDKAADKAPASSSNK